MRIAHVQIAAEAAVDTAAAAAVVADTAAVAVDAHPAAADAHVAAAAAAVVDIQVVADGTKPFVLKTEKDGAGIRKDPALSFCSMLYADLIAGSSMGPCCL